MNNAYTQQTHTRTRVYEFVLGDTRSHVIRPRFHTNTYSLASVNRTSFKYTFTLTSLIQQLKSAKNDVFFMHVFVETLNKDTWIRLERVSKKEKETGREEDQEREGDEEREEERAGK